MSFSTRGRKISFFDQDSELRTSDVVLDEIINCLQDISKIKIPIIIGKGTANIGTSYTQYFGLDNHNFSYLRRNPKDLKKLVQGLEKYLAKITAKTSDIFREKPTSVQPTCMDENTFDFALFCHYLEPLRQPSVVGSGVRNAIEQHKKLPDLFGPLIKNLKQLSEEYFRLKNFTQTLENKVQTSALTFSGSTLSDPMKKSTFRFTAESNSSSAIFRFHKEIPSVKKSNQIFFGPTVVTPPLGKGHPTLS